MAVKVEYPAIWDDQEYYPLHEEDDVPEKPPHRRQVTYLYDALGARFPEWFITSNVCIYWEPGNTRDYVAPDLFVVTEPLPEPIESSYLLWKHPPVAFVAEVGSRSSVRRDQGPKVKTYDEIVRAGEYLYFWPRRKMLRLWRRGPEGYHEVAPEANRRLRSRELGLDLGLDERGFLRLYTPDGEMLLTHEETDQQRQREAQRRREVEARWQDEVARREALERELVALRAQLERRDS